MKKFISFLMLFFLTSAIFSQEDLVLTKEKLDTGNPGLNSIWRQVKISEDFFAKHSRGGYMFALEGYLLGYEYNDHYPELNYKIGVCYLGSVYKPKSLFFLKKAYEQKNNVAKDIFWQLAKAYQYNYKFDTAIFYFNEYRKMLNSNELEKKSTLIDERIEQCKLAKEMVANPVNVDIINMAEINSEFPEYCPVITADESRIYFTARRPDCTGSSVDPNDGQYYEDIYTSKFIDGKWQNPVNIGMPLNTRNHDATVALSPDGKSMLIYRNGDLLICHKRGKKWSFPEYLPDNINTDAIENSACFSFDGKTIYFVRGKTNDPITSNGDIYVTHLKNGKWSDPEKLPPVINTNRDEDGVFLHPDGRTLYFSSMGHNTMGGFDIFKSVKNDDGTWSEPVNLGYPVNTPDDDIYFVLSADGKTGYYSSVRKNSEGFSDIYKLKFYPEKKIFQDAEDNLIASNDTTITQNLENNADFQKVYLTLVTGQVYDAITLKPISEATIEIVDNEVDSTVLTTTSDEDGNYIVTLPSGKNYGMNVNADGYLFHSENFNLPADEEFNKIVLDIPLYNITAGAKVILKNIFFDFDKATLRKTSIPELIRVVDFMNDNPQVVIEVPGHTDNRGSHEYNKKLSEARAKAVVDFLISQGIDPKRMTYRGASFDEPIATNDTDEGRQMNRRVEFKIISNK